MKIPIPGKTVFTLRWGPGWQFNIKITSYQYRKSHCGDKTISRPSYLHNGISYTGKTISLYWIGAQGICSHFPDNILKCIFLNENVWLSIKISQNFVPKGPIKNIPALVQIMAWRRPGLGSFPVFLFNSNSKSIIFNSNSNSTIQNKFQFLIQFRRIQIQSQFQK